MMPDGYRSPPLPDAAARQRALLEYGATWLVEAGAGSGKTALMAGRVVLMLAHGIRPRDIVAITFTEAAAAELLERIQGFVASLTAGTVSSELELALPTGLSQISARPLPPRPQPLTRSPARPSTASASSSSSRIRPRPASIPVLPSSIRPPPISPTRI